MGTPLPKFGTPKLARTRAIKEIPPRTSLTLVRRKPQNRAPLLTDLGGESMGKEPRRVHAYTPHQIPKRKVSKPPQEIQKSLRKSAKRRNMRDTTRL
jgi:hypothetical protein